jgi:ubiquinone/menaquinone biosynthesis C-methylase UbiE
MTASAFHIPLKDQSVDGVVCPRLCHHLPSTEERERLVRELLRVARRFVIMTYFDYDTLKNRIRRYRTRKKGKRPKKTMPRALVAALAKECGAELVAAPHLSIIGSGHRYALMTRRQD